ncbi:MAG: hypothetical protein WA855_03385, partial [Candidatus Acidiferrales bacterium]
MPPAAREIGNDADDDESGRADCGKKQSAFAAGVSRGCRRKNSLAGSRSIGERRKIKCKIARRLKTLCGILFEAVPHHAL